jgi:hypothetical protein
MSLLMITSDEVAHSETREISTAAQLMVTDIKLS